MEKTKILKIMAIYPPGRKYQRGEDRSQGNLDNSVATAMRAANDLGYVSAIAKANGHISFVKDYQSEDLQIEHLESDFLSLDPDLVVMSITNSTIFEDLIICKKLRKIKKDVKIAIKGSLFFNPRAEIFDQLDLVDVDYLVGGEIEFIIEDILKALTLGKSILQKINGISYKKGDRWITNEMNVWSQRGDDIPFPDRSSMNNNLYIRPDTGKPMATIATSRGCGAKCTYCLTPIISGTHIRYRSPESIFKEIEECVNLHGINDFFFKSDTFTMNRHWVEKLCVYLINSNLSKKIRWVANSRVNPLQLETLLAMKEAGCDLVAFGFESGSTETLERIKKGATREQNIEAREMVKKSKMDCFGFFLIGLPWEGKAHLKDTEELIFQMDCEYLELHIAVPYFGTTLHQEILDKGLLDGSPLGKDYFNRPTLGTGELSMDTLESYRKRLLLKYHLRPRYIGKKILNAKINPRTYYNYAKYGIRLLKNSVA